MQVVAPLYKPPSRKTITSMLDSKYATLSAKVKADLENIESLSLTTDCWTEMGHSKSYMGVTVHYPHSNLPKIVSINLGCFPLDNNHTDNYLSSELAKICTEWNIKKNVIVAIVTDNAANAVKSVKDFFDIEKENDLMINQHIPCFAHTVQLVPGNAIKNTALLPDLIGRIKKIVTFFKQSNAAADQLRKIQMDEGKTEGTILKLIQDVDTRWNSSYYMIERFLLLSKPVSTVLLNLRGSPQMICADDIQVLQEFLDLLKPIEQITREMSAEEHVTCSKIIPIIKCLAAALNKKTPETVIGMVLQDNLKNECSSRFDNYSEKHPLLLTATLLDPRFKKIHLDNNLAVARAIRNVSREMQFMTSTQISVNNSAEQSQSLNDDDNLWGYHEQKIQTLVVDRDEPGGVSSELRNYLSKNVISRDKDPLVYWKEAKYSFPNIYRVAKKYLHILATSVPSERLFSRAGFICSDRRNRLIPKRLSELVFLSSIGEDAWGF